MRRTDFETRDLVFGTADGLAKRFLAFGLVSLLIATVVPGPGVQAGHLQEGCEEALDPLVCGPVGTAEELCEEILPPICAHGWVEEAKLTAFDGAAGDRFGWSVALDGDTALIGVKDANVGSNSNQGAAYVYKRVGAVWVMQAKLAALDGAAGDSFGFSVALDGDTAFIGAPFADVDSNTRQGAAYVYERVGAVWVMQTKLATSDGSAHDIFGMSVALEDDTALVGARADAYANNKQGAVYVYERVGTGWIEQAELTASDGEIADGFGWSIALDADTALIGAFGAGGSFQGDAYVFERVGAVWNEQAKLTASDGAFYDHFGVSVALDGNTAIMGAPYARVDGNEWQGAAYVFEYDGNGWIEHAKLTGSDGARDDYFGWSVALDGDTALIGAPGADVDGNPNQGAAYVYERIGTGWIEDAKLTGSDGQAGDGFGGSVALDGDTGLIGAPFADVDGNVEQGAVYVYQKLLQLLEQ